MVRLTAASNTRVGISDVQERRNARATIVRSIHAISAPHGAFETSACLRVVDKVR